MGTQEVSGLQSLGFRIDAHLSIMLIRVEKLEELIVFKQTNWIRYQKAKREIKSARKCKGKRGRRRNMGPRDPKQKPRSAFAMV